MMKKFTVDEIIEKLTIDYQRHDSDFKVEFPEDRFKRIMDYLHFILEKEE